MATSLQTDALPWSDLEAAIGGELILPGDPRYEEARRVWNGMIDRRPAAIARCQSVDDVVTAVRFAREHGLPIAVRGGGHNAAGLAVVDDGLVIDLSAMNAVEVDAERRIARAGGGATWGDSTPPPRRMASPAQAAPSLRQALPA